VISPGYHAKKKSYMFLVKEFLRTLRISKQNKKFLTTEHNIHRPVYPLYISKNLASPLEIPGNKKADR
jgi:hypothetical protein